MVAQTKQLDAQHWGGGIILIGIILGAIGNLRQAKPSPLTPDTKSD